MKELTREWVEPPQLYPRIGWARFYHALWTCTVYYEEVTKVGWPVPHVLRDNDAKERIDIEMVRLRVDRP